MNRIALILLLGFSMLISFSVQADGRGRHYNKHHHHGHHNKHQVRYSHRRVQHYRSHGHRPYGCGYGSHSAYGAYPGVSSVGYIAFDTRHGVSAGGELVVRGSYP